MRSKPIILDLDRRIVRLLSVMAEEDCRSIPQQLTWLIRKEAASRNSVGDITSQAVTAKQRRQAEPRVDGVQQLGQLVTGRARADQDSLNS